MPYIGEIRIFAGTFAPNGWFLCNGALLSVAQYTPLFALLSYTYGGDGRNSFAVPDLRGRVPLHAGDLLGATYTPGQMGGTEKKNVYSYQLPAHIHTISGSVYQPVLGENPGQLTSPDNAYMAITNGQQVYSTAKHATNRMAPLKTTIQVQPAGSGQPIENMQPHLPLNFIICAQGNFPPRS
ncbi:phage tail protein [Chitinophaga oryzae]|uniref:Phage tail protein n=1 Tax=Chitinophaga oryzae TaxID=2725414 RepID=A0AAE7D898_9BACT|nr:tail fiber protein [Chitinophaga oryzae]QJB31863.1 phage tail protein [Chitinophaga oryzae]QJB38340.1 phage tail protein [Chitinophaga oryzae]